MAAFNGVFYCGATEIIDEKGKAKHFFFEKKKQKTFGPLRALFEPPTAQTTREAVQKFLRAFF